MPAPTAAADMAKTYSASVAKVTYADGTSKDFPLTYNKLFGVKDKVGGNANPAGQLYDHKMAPAAWIRWASLSLPKPRIPTAC